jgi:hypothetical protein
MELPLEDLPKDVLEMIEEGPQSRPMSERGVQLKEVLEQKEKEKKCLQVLAETESDESIEEGEATEDSEEEDQVDANGMDVEEKMTEMFIKKVLELELPLEDLTKDVLEMIEEGPQSRPVREGCTSERSA